MQKIVELLVFLMFHIWTTYTCRHHSMAGKEMRLEQVQTATMSQPARVGVMRDGYVIGLVIAQ